MLDTQWRMSFSGPIGLDYIALPPVFDLLEIPGPERCALFFDLRTMERAALTTMNDMRKERAASRSEGGEQ